MSNIEHEAATWLKKNDPTLGRVVDVLGPIQLTHQTDYFKALVQKIVFQQLSTKAASTILGRMEELIEKRYDPESMVKYDQEAYRAAGISRQKYTYIADLCQHFLDEPSFYHNLDQQVDEDVISKLTAVRGIGVWTAQMFLMSTLGRPDVFAPDDVGLQNAIYNLYGINEKMNRKALIAFAERWKPYRSYASRYLWRSLDEDITPIQ